MSLRRGLLVVALAAAVAASVTAQRSGSATSVTTVDKAVLQRVIDAWASKDPKKAEPFYAKDAGLVFYDLAPRKYDGWTAYEKGTTEMFKTVKSLTMKVTDDAQVHTAGNVAWAAATVDGEMVGTDGSREKINARWSTVWEKRAGGWTIVHDHFSLPVPEPAPKPSKP
jgi:uncharacterized protein (TIGR02246 family)